MALFFHAHARRKLAGERVVEGVALSPREFECLRWSAQGKSAWEIGCILGISRRTVSFHLDNAKAKLDVRTVRQAAVRLAASQPTLLRSLVRNYPVQRHRVSSRLSASSIRHNPAIQKATKTHIVTH